MNKLKLHIIEASKQAISLLLLVSFMYVTFLPLIHSHTCTEHYENFMDHKSSSVSSVCKGCSDYAHHQGKEFDLPYPPVFTSLLPAPIEYSRPTCAGIYKMTLNAFSNKGPPTLF
ncbi:hypothetical protein DVR12_13965 [Chitinophaga silvatica]|uniref:Uncharacterized protein n=1 Tax=Chitinophaga silvatica TaxID=2282649 RepID=A0A3E1Y8M4_9BACT|nr:hypothetical protein [Chitinophaga silvatica]RFS21762.1 hypothetical protein DVR12_13965 [Chitinophaga silvatica]